MLLENRAILSLLGQEKLLWKTDQAVVGLSELPKEETLQWLGPEALWKEKWNLSEHQELILQHLETGQRWWWAQSYDKGNSRSPTFRRSKWYPWKSWRWCSWRPRRSKRQWRPWQSNDVRSADSQEAILKILFQPDEVLNISLITEDQEGCWKIIAALSCSVEHTMPEMAADNPLDIEPSQLITRIIMLILKRERILILPSKFCFSWSVLRLRIRIRKLNRKRRGLCNPSSSRSKLSLQKVSIITHLFFGSRESVFQYQCVYGYYFVYQC